MNTRPWLAEDLALVFTTCPREPAYFAASLASVLGQDARTEALCEIAAVVDAPDLDCLGRLASDSRVRCMARTMVENERVASFHLHRRASHNYCRALALAPRAARAVLVCEDDVIFREGWLGLLLQALEEMRADGLEDFILAAYTRHDLERPGLRRGTFYSSYPARRFHATPAMLYPAPEAAAVREWIWAHGVVNREGPYDLLIGRRAVARRHLYATRYSIVQHVGMTSTGLGPGGRQSASFAQPWPTVAP